MPTKRGMSVLGAFKGVHVFNDLKTKSWGKRSEYSILSTVVLGHLVNYRKGIGICTIFYPI